MQGVVSIEEGMTDLNYNGSNYNSWLLRKKFVRTVFIPRLIENVSFLCGSIIAALLMEPGGTMGFVDGVPRALPLSE